MTLGHISGAGTIGHESGTIWHVPLHFGKWLGTEGTEKAIGNLCQSLNQASHV